MDANFSRKMETRLKKKHLLQINAITERKKERGRIVFVEIIIDNDRQKYESQMIFYTQKFSSHIKVEKNEREK